MPDIGREQSFRREYAGILRHHDAAHAELTRQHAAVERPGAPEGDQVEVAEIEAAARGDRAEGLGQLRIGDADDALRRRLDSDAEWHGDILLDRSPRQAGVELDLAAE